MEEDIKPQDTSQDSEPLPENVTNTEETPAVEESVAEPVVDTTAPVVDVKPEEKPGEKREPLRAPAAQKTFWSKALPWVIVALVFYLGGLATIFFAVHQPAKKAAEAAAATAVEEIASLNNEVSQLELQKSQVQNELDTTRGNLVDTQEDLTAAQATIEEQLTEVSNANVKRLAYKFLGNINSARAALEKLDTASARQALNFAKTDLAEMEASGLAADALSGFTERLDEAITNLTETGLDKSRAALDTLYANLLLLVDNLP